ncbi:MAG: hypothetical protein LBD45_04020 [Bacteroidales bacterium]|jgi:hypothetical protein|nr:hypothetical protein [Bacteroidales bacterium]
MKNAKTNFFLFLLFCKGISLQAQATETNMVQNPGFENTDYTLFKYESYDNCPTLVSGWDLIANPTFTDDYNNVGLNKYIVRGTMGFFGAADPASDGDANNRQYLRIQQYEWYGSSDGKPGTTEPGTGGIQQTVDVVPNATYSFSFLYRLSSHAESGKIVQAYYSITSGGTDIVSGTKLYNELDEKWYEREKKFTVPETASTATLHLYISAPRIYTWGGNISQWIDVDNVKLVREETSAITITDGSQPFKALSRGHAVSFSGLNDGDIVDIWHVSGQKVKQFTADRKSEDISLPPGIYIAQEKGKGQAAKFVIY